MANLVFSAVGATAGYLVGGPTGAMIGWTLASSLTAEDVKMQQPTIGDLRVPTSGYGTNIPIAVGRQRVTGNVIWATDKVPYESTTVHGGKGGGGVEVVTTGYRISMAIVLCKGPILGISKVWRDGQIVVDSAGGAAPMPGTLYLGDNSQTADATMESHLGAGNVPGYRGLAYMVLTDFDLGQAGRVPIWSFEVLRQGGL